MSIDEDNARAALINLFGRSLADHEDSLSECLSLVRLYALTPQTLFYRWEAFALSSLPPQARDNPTLQDFRALRQNLQSSLDAAAASSSSAYAQTPRKDALSSFGGGGGSASRTGASSARKMMGLGGLMGAQTPSRPSALSRGSHHAANAANGNGVGDDSMDMDDSPLRPGAINGAALSAWRPTQTLNAKIPQSNGSESRASSSRVALAVGTDPRKWQYRYMFERGGERGEALDDSLESYSSLIVETYGISEEDLGDPSHTHQQSVYVVGRITPNLSVATKSNSDAATAGLPRLKPSADGILIESSKLQGAGARVPIRFEKDCTIRRPPGDDDIGGPQSAAELLGLFPGMVVGLKGRNGGGDGFGVEEVLLLPSLYQASTAPSRLLELHHTSLSHLRGQPLSIAVASGPYTSNEDLDFAPWHALVDNIEREPVDVVVFLGPFLPLSHPLLPTSSIMPADIFKRHFASRLNALTSSSSSSTTPILVPSVLDALTSHAAWPQPKYDAGELGLTKKTKLLPNPCLFSVNEVVVGVSTADVLRDLRSEELVVRLKKAAAAGAASQQQPQQSEDVIARAVRHVLSQRSFYPLFPPPQPRASSTNSSAEEPPLPLSLPHLDLALWQTVTPDVLLLPSSHLKPFAKIVDGTIVVNPGNASGGGDEDGQGQAQGQGQGQAAKLTILPLPRAELERGVEKEGDEPRGHDVWERARVDLLSVPVQAAAAGRR